MKKHYRNDNNCLNCGTILSGKFCHNCGQENLEIKEDFFHMVNHAVSDYFHFDHQFFHTLKPLVLKPGKLTNEYMAGKRVQYLHPIKMYIFISLVYFLLLLNFKPHIQTNNHTLTPQQKTHVIDSLKNILATNHNLPEKSKDKILRRINNLQKSESQDLVVYDGDGTGDEPKNYTEYLKAQAKFKENDRDNMIERYLMQKNFSWKEKEKSGMDVKERLVEYFMHNLSKVMFVLLPLFALILKVAFNKNRKYYVEHLIFSIHFHCFFYLFSSLMILLGLALPEAWKDSATDVLIYIGVVITLWYFYRSLKTVYNRSRFRTITKMAGVTFVYFLTLVMAFCFLLFLTIVFGA